MPILLRSRSAVIIPRRAGCVVSSRHHHPCADLHRRRWLDVVPFAAVRHVREQRLFLEWSLSAQAMSPVEPPPLVIVEGFLSSAGAVVWGNFEEHCNYACLANGEQIRRTIFARCVRTCSPG